MNTVGNIAGPLLAYEVLTAFFLEATFLSIMLFDAQRVSPRTLTVATFMVAFGTTMSAFWILALNSWMHTPVGFEMINDQAHATDWLAILFNPSMPYRLPHMLLASSLTVAFLVAGISAFRWLRGDRGMAVMAALKTAIAIPIQIGVVDLHGINTLQHQPAKTAAIEALWQTQRGAPLLLFALPDEAQRTNHYSLGNARAASLILTHEANGEIQALDTFIGRHPPVAPVFWAFRVMVGSGLLMLAVSLTSFWYLQGRHALPTMLARVLVGMTFIDWLATLAGWYVTEIGRQHYLVYGVLTTAEAASTIAAPMIATTLMLYLRVYLVLTLSYVSVIFHLARKAGKTSSTLIREASMHAPQQEGSA